MAVFTVPKADRPLAEALITPNERAFVGLLTGVLVLVLPLVDFLGKTLPTKSAFESLYLEMGYFMMSLPPKRIFITLRTARDLAPI